MIRERNLFMNWRTTASAKTPIWLWNWTHRTHTTHHTNRSSCSYAGRVSPWLVGMTREHRKSWNFGDDAIIHRSVFRRLWWIFCWSTSSPTITTPACFFVWAEYNYCCFSRCSKSHGAGLSSTTFVRPFSIRCTALGELCLSGGWVDEKPPICNSNSFLK